MSSQKTNFTVGLFVLIGLIISFVVILWLGMSSYLEKGRYFVAYFDESVQGLDKDSPLKYRGVSIGRVDSISVAPDATLIQVVLKIETDLKPGKNMVAQLKTVGITGLVFVELDRKQACDEGLSPKLNFPVPHQVIATKPSDIKQFIDSVNEVLTMLKGLDMEGISNKALDALDEVKLTLKNVEIQKLSADMSHSLEVWNDALNSVNEAADSFNTLTASANKTVTRLDSIVAANENEFSEAVASLNKSLRNASEVLEQGAELVKNTDSNVYNLMQHLLTSMQNIEKATVNLNRTLEVIADQPSQLLYGDPLPSRPVEQEN